MQQVKWGEYKIEDLFSISNTLSFNSDVLVDGYEYDYVTRTSFNQGILQTTGFVNKENINSAGNWSLGLLQMDFFYRKKPWYAGQFVRKVIPKFELSDSAILFFTTLLNRLKPTLLSVLVRDVDKTFLNSTIQVPITVDGKIDFGFIAEFVAELEAQRVAELETYLQATGLKDYTLTKEEQLAIDKLKKQEIQWEVITYQTVFDNIKQGRRLKKDDQIAGNIPFVMAGTTNTGVVGYISNPVAYFPQNAITIDIFGNTFYRNYAFGAGDDTGVYWNESYKYTEEQMLFFTTSMAKSIHNQYSFGNKLRSSQSLNIEMLVPINKGEIDLYFIDTLVVAIKKLVIKDVVEYADEKIFATKEVIAYNK